jgi:hypothetical protein
MAPLISLIVLFPCALPQILNNKYALCFLSTVKYKKALLVLLPKELFTFIRVFLMSKREVRFTFLKKLGLRISSTEMGEIIK